MLLPKTKNFARMLGIVLMMTTWLPSRLLAQPEEADNAPLDLSEFPGMIIDDVVVPVPSEIFSIMGKLGEERFAGEIVERKNFTFRNRSRLALAFGVAVADGFIAVQAQNKNGIEQAGRTVLKLSEALGLKDRVLKHTQAIIRAADQDQWDAVRQELDRTQKTVRETMEEMRDGDLANCVSVGGWIRGTEAMTSLISKSYKTEQAELLNQPDLALHFSELIGEMGKDVLRVPQIKAADACLKQIAVLMGDGDSVIDSKSVGQIHMVSKSLVGSVFQEEGGSR
ncbi:MAG: hypothetical protein ACI8XO_004849 [Verrucomicrobiales bacterium]|jgi:hypothetical protein